MKRKIEHINDFANLCGYFENACIEKNININNGYNCIHPEQGEYEMVDKLKIGKCFSSSCPLGFDPDEEDFENPEIDNNGYEYQEGEFLVVSVSQCDETVRL